MIDTIYLDLDGVLCDFVTPALKLCGVEAKYEDVTDYDIPKALGVDPDPFWKTIMEAPAGWWANLLKYPWADSVYESIKRPPCYRGVVTPILTTAISPASAHGKTIWCGYHTPVCPCWPTQDKTFYATPNSLLVDDCPANVDAWRAACGKAILFPQPWNDSKLTVDDVLDAVRRGADA